MPYQGWQNRYAVRRVNPFLGVLQVVECETGRASSANGVVWDLELSSLVPEGGKNSGDDPGQPAYIRCGLWSAREGLVSHPLSPSDQDGVIRGQVEQLIDLVRETLPMLPLTLADTQELWLFDQDNRIPLALLASAIPAEKEPGSMGPRYWAASLGSDGVPSQRRFPAARELEAAIRQRAGFNLQRHWLIRQADGSGVQIDNNRIIDRDQIPTLLINEEWNNETQQALVENYIHWTAPALLTLQHLNRRERLRLEKNLYIQAHSVEHHWRLYPESVNGSYLRAARVQSRLQQANH